MTASLPRMLMLARVPELGGVKSRLARHVGEAQALRVHIELLQHNAVLAASTGLPFELHYSGNPRAGSGFLQSLARDLGAELVPQVSGNIGAKMLAAASYSTQPSVLIGADCADLSAAYLENAVAGIAKVEVVLGPAADGGYVLVAQREPVPALFRDIEWGTGKVLAQTRRQAQAAGVSWAELAVRWDVDGVEDLRRYRRERQGAERH